MKIRGNTIGTPIKPDKTLVKAQNLTEAEKRQARENIGAWGGDNDYLRKLVIAGQDQDSETIIYSGGSTGNRNAVLRFDGAQYANAPVLRGIAGGIDNNDAATVGQLKDEINYSQNLANDTYVSFAGEQNLTEEQELQARRNIGAASFQTVSKIEQDMENELLPLADSALTVGVQEWSEKQKAQARHNIGAISEPQLDEVIDYIADNCVQYTQAGDGLTESQKANARQNIDAVSYSELMAVENNIDDLDSKVGDIEAALDAIIALQNNIINGYVVPATLNDEGGDGV